MKKFISIIIASLALILQLQAQSEPIMITGKLSSDTGEELIAAHVIEIDKNQRIISSTITDYNGEFSLQIKNTANSIKFSYIGFKTQVLPINNQRHFLISLKDETMLTEVQITAKKMHNDGTFPIPEREISGAVQTINTKIFDGMSVASIDDALQGRIAGLDIVGNSGDLGSGSSLRIRGITSITGNSTPLILLNNIPFESNIDASFDFNNSNDEQFAQLLNISPDDIEEITVLKDGAAAAIWGSKGANGVISIKTKKGVRGPTLVSYSYRFSGSKQPKGIKMLSGDDYTMLMKQAYFNRYLDEEECNIPEFNYDEKYSEYQMFNNNTDWVKAITQHGITHDHSLSVSGGGEKARFRASLGYYKQTGTVICQELERFSTRMNLEYQVSDRLKFISDFSMTYTDNDKSYADKNEGDWDYESLMDIAYRKAPNISIYQQDADGNNLSNYYTIPQSSQLNESQRDLVNPVAMANLATYKQTNMRIIPTLRLQYDFLDPASESQLRYNGYISFDIENTHDKKFRPRELTSKTWLDELVNRAYTKKVEGVSVMTDQNITWMPKLNNENHSLLLYGSWQLISGNSLYQEFNSYGLPSQSMENATSEGFNSIANSVKGQWRSMALLGRIHYVYKERYIFDGTLRRDGSTRFGANNRWGTFPALSGKWIISDENFMAKYQNFLSELSIRAGWGVTGNQPDSEYLHYSRYNSSWSSGSSYYMDMPTLKPASIKLANLKWERSSSYNLGFNLNLFDYRYTLDANVYHRRTTDLLFKDQAIPSSTGYSSIKYINAGTMDNNGWEINFSTDRMLKFNKWTIDVNFNFSNNVNKIKKLDDSVLDSYNGTFDYQNGSYLTRIQEGNSFGSIYGFRFKGVYQWDSYVEGREGTCPVVHDAEGNVVKDSYGQAIPMYFAYNTTNARKFRGGDAIYEDVNNDGTIDELDIVYLGNCNPKLNGGFGFTVRYSNFTVNSFFNFRYGNKIINYARMYAENMYSNDNQSIAVNWRWRQEGDLTNMPRALYQDGRNWLGSDRFVEDGSFLRWKQLTISYACPMAVLKPLGLGKLNFNLTLNNLLTFTSYTGVDPEVGYDNKGICADRSKTPRSKYFTLGVTANF